MPPARGRSPSPAPSPARGFFVSQFPTALQPNVATTRLATASHGQSLSLLWPAARYTRYRPRQPRASPVWQVLRDHAQRLTYLPPEAARALARYQRGGDLHAGFTRLHCAACGHDYLLAFSCKQRGLCATCHQRRTLIEAAAIADEICQPVPHRHLVLTLPRVLRGLFHANPPCSAHSATPPLKFSPSG